MAQIILDESAAPAAPSAGKVTFYAKSDGLPYSKDDAGTETALGGAPASADFLVKTAVAGLSAERVVTDGTSITADWAVAGEVTFKRAALTGDVTAAADGNTTTLANIPNDTPQVGSILETAIAAPASPAAGKVKVFADSTDLRFHDKNAAGTVGTTVVADAGASNNFLTAISAAGVISKAQPTDANLGFSDITTGNASTTAHGFAPKATAPSAGLLSALAIGNGETVRTDQPLFDTTNPAALGTVGPGTALVAARRDHIHPNPALDTLAAPTDITTLNASTSAHGLLPKLSNVSTEFLNGTGTFSTPASGGGKPFLAWTAQGNQPGAATYATPDTRNSHPVLDFDAATDEDAIFGGVLPTAYAGGGLTIEIYWTATSATTGDVVWNADIERMNTDLDADSFVGANTATSTTNATSGIITKTTITFTDGADMDSLAAGEAFRLKITRDANAAGDTMAGDAELHRVVMRET